MRDMRAYGQHLRLAAADFRRLSDNHGEAGNPEISRKLAAVAVALDAEADELEPSPAALESERPSASSPS
jgi:hypothetical protein